MPCSSEELSFMKDCADAAIDAAKDENENGIASLIVMDGVVIAEGTNRVFADCDPTHHAEIIAIGKACQTIGKPDLEGATLYSSLEPCEMCLGAIAFSGIRRVVFAAQRANVAPKYFMYPSLTLMDFIKASKNPLTVVGGVHEDVVIHLYEDGDA